MPGATETYKEKEILSHNSRSRIISLAGFMGCGKSSVGRELAALLSCSFTDLDEYIEQREGRTIPEIFSTDGEEAFRAMEHKYLSEIIMVRDVEDSGKKQTNLSSHFFSTQTNLSSRASAEGSHMLILSLGGGTLTTQECARMTAEHTTCIYLRATTDTLVRNLQDNYKNRPMLQSATESAVSSASDTALSSSGQSPNPEPNRQLRARIGDLMRKRSAIYESTAHHIIDTDGKSFPEIVQEITLLLKP